MVPNYLIGDPAYPLIPCCMKEYTCCKNNERVIFNAMLRSARNPIECASRGLVCACAYATASDHSHEMKRPDTYEKSLLVLQNFTIARKSGTMF